MVCENCDRRAPGAIIKTTKDGHCVLCGKDVWNRDNVPQRTISKTWDKYFFDICGAIASKSPCLSRQIGAILVRDKSIVSTGYNGPPRCIPHCGHERFISDNYLNETANNIFYDAVLKKPHPEFMVKFRNTCPRKVMGFESGEGMQWCPAQHAEENAISNASRLGVSTIDTVLYMNSVIPCQKCFGTLINAGIIEIVVEEDKVYDKHTQFLIDNSDIKIRRFEL